MQVTNVTVKLSPHSADRLKAFCTMTLDGEFVVRDLKVIEGTHGLFVAMPSRKLTDHCPKCGGKNHLRAKYCNDCGNRLSENRVSDEDEQGKLHADVAHPINSECRARFEAAVLEAYDEERARAGRPEEAPPAEDTPAEEETTSVAEATEPTPAPEETPPEPTPELEPAPEPEPEGTAEPIIPESEEEMPGKPPPPGQAKAGPEFGAGIM